MTLAPLESVIRDAHDRASMRARLSGHALPTVADVVAILRRESDLPWSVSIVRHALGEMRLKASDL